MQTAKHRIVLQRSSDCGHKAVGLRMNEYYIDPLVDSLRESLDAREQVVLSPDPDSLCKVTEE